MIRCLRLKFVCINMVIVTLMLLAIFVTVYQLTRQNLERESVQMMQSIVQSPVQLMRPDELEPGVRLPYFALEISQNGEVQAAGGGYYDLSDQSFLQEVAQEAMAAEEDVGVLGDYRLRYCRVDTPIAQLVVFADVSSEASTMRHLVWTCVGIGCASFLVFLVISILLARWAVKPVEKAWDQQRQFVADASHELKTPLTVILTNAELLRAVPPEEQEDFARNILTMSRKMKGLVEELLDLARVDHGIPREVQKPVRYSDLVRDALLPFEPLFYEQGLSFIWNIQPDITLRGSPEHLSRVVQALLDNACKYTAAGGSVRLCLQKNSRKSCTLQVSNTGDPISQEDLRNIFKRFYRRDQVRSLSGSYGLGLAICQEIVTRHRGKIWAESSGGINRFFVQLPIQ